MKRQYAKGNYAVTYTELPLKEPGVQWRDGMVSGNGENGYITSGAPYSDHFIFQYMWFNFPSPEPRSIPEELTGQLEEARHHVFRQDDQWKVRAVDGSVRRRTFYYSYHPGHQLRLDSMNKGQLSDYERWTNYETAETGVRYVDEGGEWIRTAFTSREDNVTITRLTSSSTGAKLNVVLSIDDISSMCKAYDSTSEVSALQYKKLVSKEADYIAQVAHYPAYEGSELAEGGYAGLTRVIAVNGRKRRIVLPASGEPMNVGAEPNPAIQVLDADAIYLITQSNRTHEMGRLDAFAAQASYPIIEQLCRHTELVARKYGAEKGHFDYEAALAPHARQHAAEFNAVQLSLAGDEQHKHSSNEQLIAAQQSAPHRVNHVFLEQVYQQGRYAMMCCGGASAPRLYGMWTGEWNPGWRGIYTLDANVNLQVAAMNTGQLEQAALGYIVFFLRNAPDFEYNARMAYGMHDALQVSVNSDGDRAMHVEYDNDYPFQYWNAGASWCLLPIYEYWQCRGNRRIPIVAEMRFEQLRSLLSVQDGGCTEQEFAELAAGGYLDLERHILLPLLTKQANFWEQICTPAYYTDASGRACHEPGKKALEPGERYMLLPAYSPENHPIGYFSTITANAAMDIAAARDGLRMVIALEKAVQRPNYEAAIRRWERLLKQLPEYRLDDDGALREWAMNEYTENNDHRHLSHLYAAWPAYETQHDAALAEAANIALHNRERYNTNDATAGHGWMHKALVYARLKDGEGMLASLLPMMNEEGYYPSLMTDHDTNRRNHCYCTDTLFGTVAAVQEALLFSDEDVVELLPALPSGWSFGSIRGLLARTRLEVVELSWDTEQGTVRAVIRSGAESRAVKIGAGRSWTRARVNGKAAAVVKHGHRRWIELELAAHEEAEIELTGVE